LSDDLNSGALSLAFSPPNQEENARNEQKYIEEDEKMREERISEAKNEGRYLEFSPRSFTCRNFKLNEDEGETKNNDDAHDDDQENGAVDNVEEEGIQLEERRRSAGVKRSGSSISELSNSQQQQSDLELRDDIKEIKQTLGKFVDAERRSSDAGMLLKLQMDNKTLEEECTRSKELAAEKERLDAKLTQLESLQKESSQQMETLECNLEAAQKEKLQLLTQITGLEEDLKTVNAALSTNEDHSKVTEELMAQNNTLKTEKTDLQSEVKRMEEDHAKVTEELMVQNNTLKTEKTDLQSEVKRMEEDHMKVAEELVAQNNTLKTEKTDLQSQVKRMEEGLETYKNKFENSESQLQTTLAKVKQYDMETQDRESTINDLMERIEKMKEAAAEKDEKIKELQAELAKVQKKNKQTRECFSKEKETVEASLASLKSALEASADNLRKSRHSEEQKNERVLALERELLETKAKLETAVHRLNTTDEREGDLLAKLRTSNQIRRYVLLLSYYYRCSCFHNVFNPTILAFGFSQLHNRVMQLSGNIRVFVRVRPILPGEDERLAAALAESSKGKRGNNKKAAANNINNMESPFYFPGELDGHNTSCESDDLTKRIIEMKEPAKDRGGLSERRKVWRYPFDNVFSPQSGQEDVWDAVSPLVQSAIDGYPCCIFAYGQTGSGKTHTMLGEPGNEGIIARSVNLMFEKKREIEEFYRGTSKVEMSIELLEIYNEQVRDLLATSSGSNGREVSLKVTSNEVVGNAVLPASNEEQVMKYLALAQSRRCVKATQSNAESSRSHMVFTISFSVEMDNGMKRVGKLNICDLAGSERLSKSGANEIVKVNNIMHFFTRGAI